MSRSWFVRNVADAAWMGSEELGLIGQFEGDGLDEPAEPFQVGLNIRVLQPGQVAAMYHHEADDEHFLVLFGEALAIVEGQVVPLNSWDLLHTPGGTSHAIVGAGDGPCGILMVGGRVRPRPTHYPVDPTAARFGASVARETNDSAVAYGRLIRPKPVEGPRGMPWRRA